MDRAIDRTFDAAALFDEYGIPANLRAGLERYLKDGIEPGGFLCAVIDHDLSEAVLRAADLTTEHAVGPIIRFLVYEASAQAHGSRALRLAWIESHRRERAEHRTGRPNTTRGAS